MKDIPIFTTENGAASLVLREIPYRGIAYIKIQSSLAPDALIEECAEFCTMCGADMVVATGDPALEKYPFRNAVIQRRRPLEGLPETDAALFPVQEQTLKQWLEFYNTGMKNVANAAWMTERDGLEMLEKGDGYFIHRGEQLLGIGKASYDKIGAIVAVQRGAGADVVLALCSALTADTAMLEVASNNDRAVRLYDRLGFVPTAELSRWYRVK
jgi:ribosomal protein S18 acetylase RimI-like enzyme